MAHNASSTTFSSTNSTNSSSSPLRILQWNCNGYYSKLNELKSTLLNNKNTFPHIICLQETKLKNTQTVKLPEYSIVRKDRLGTSAGGGVLIAIHKSISYSEIELTTIHEAIAVTLKTETGHLSILNIYNPPGNMLDLDFLYPLSNLHKSLLIVGDLNSHSPLWSPSRPDLNGEKIDKFLEDSNFAVLNTDTPTRINLRGQDSLLDLTLASANLALKTALSVLPFSMGSDHFPINLSINESISFEETFVSRYNLRKADWKTFKSLSTININSSIVDSDIQTFYTNILNAIRKTADSTIPKTHPPKSPKIVPYWNEKCKAATAKRNRLLNVMKINKTPQTVENYKKARAEAQKTIREEKTKSWQDYTSTLTDSTKLSSVWRMAKRMEGNNSNSHTPSIVVNNKTYDSNSQKAEILAEHFSNISSNNNYQASFIKRKDRLENKWKNATPTEDPKTSPLNSEITLYELQTAINQTKTKTSPGEDKIPYEFLKNLSKSSLKIILLFVNALWDSGSFIPEWKTSIVIPILKAGEKPSDPNAYRPIALTSCLCKIMERIVANRLTWYLETENLLNPLQTGFRKNKNTVDQLIRLQDSANKSINTKGYTAAIFLDYSKAFDMLWTEGLLYKLRKLKIFGNTYTWIENFLKGRSIKVRLGTELSTSKKIENGVPQGSVIAPLLFIIMMNDFPTLNDPTIQTSLFADDSAIWKSGKNLKHIIAKLQHQLNQIANWSWRWGFKINPKKTHCLIFTRRKIKGDCNIYLKNQKIENVKTFKFLGMIFDQTLNWKDHIKYVAAKARKAINLLAALKGKTWGSSKTALLQIYRSIVRSKFDYGSELLFTAYKSNLKTLDSIQHRSLSICCGAAKTTPLIALQNECGEFPLNIHRLRNLLRHVARVKINNSNPAQSCLEQTWENIYGKFKHENQPVATQVQPITPLLETFTDKPIFSTLPIWDLKPIKIDTKLTKLISKRQDDPSICKQIALDHLTKYSQATAIYTDGSKYEDKVGFGIHIPNPNTKIQAKLQEAASIFTAELTAIKFSLVWIQLQYLQNQLPPSKYVIYSDSLSSLQALKNIDCKNINELLDSILTIHNQITQAGHDVTMVWIPSHVDIAGNEEADKYAKEAASMSILPLPHKINLADCYAEIEKYLIALWQIQYNSTDTATHYKQIEPVVNKKLKFSSKNQKMERVITRLRLGHCHVNLYRFKLKFHQTGNCDHCQVPETVEHLLLKCPEYSDIPKDENITLANFFTSPHLYRTYRKILQNNRDI